MVSNGETVSNIMLSSLVVLIAAGKTSLPGLLWQLPADPLSDIWLVLYSWKTRGRWVNELVHLFTHFETSYQSCQPSKDTNILLYHVVPGFVEARELKDGFIKTAQGQEIEVDINSGRVSSIPTCWLRTGSSMWLIRCCCRLPHHKIWSPQHRQTPPSPHSSNLLLRLDSSTRFKMMNSQVSLDSELSFSFARFVCSRSWQSWLRPILRLPRLEPWTNWKGCPISEISCSTTSSLDLCTVRTRQRAEWQPPTAHPSMLRSADMGPESSLTAIPASPTSTSGPPTASFTWFRTCWPLRKASLRLHLATATIPLSWSCCPKPVWSKLWADEGTSQCSRRPVRHLPLWGPLSNSNSSGMAYHFHSSSVTLWAALQQSRVHIKLNFNQLVYSTLFRDGKWTGQSLIVGSITSYLISIIVVDEAFFCILRPLSVQ